MRNESLTSKHNQLEVCAADLGHETEDNAVSVVQQQVPIVGVDVIVPVPSVWNWNGKLVFQII